MPHCDHIRLTLHELGHIKFLCNKSKQGSSQKLNLIVQLYFIIVCIMMKAIKYPQKTQST